MLQKSFLDVEFLFELFYNLANGITKKRRLTALTDFLTNYKIVAELMFPPRNDERIEPYDKRVHRKNRKPITLCRH